VPPGEEDTELMTAVVEVPPAPHVVEAFQVNQ
jgi:hypothetical protein